MRMESVRGDVKIVNRVSCVVLLIGLVFAMPSAQASSNFNLNVSDRAFGLSLGTDLTGTGLYGSVGYLEHRRRGSVGDAALELVANANPGGHPIWIGLGARLVYADASLIHESGSALAVGVSFHTTWVGYNRLGFGGHVYYAPNAVAFGATDRYLEYEAHFGYYLLRHGLVYVGYRHVGVAYAGTPVITLDSGVNVGFRISF